MGYHPTSSPTANSKVSLRLQLDTHACVRVHIYAHTHVHTYTTYVHMNTRDLWIRNRTRSQLKLEAARVTSHTISQVLVPTETQVGQVVPTHLQAAGSLQGGTPIYRQHCSPGNPPCSSRVTSQGFTVQTFQGWATPLVCLRLEVQCLLSYTHAYSQSSLNWLRPNPMGR